MALEDSTSLLREALDIRYYYHRSTASTSLVQLLAPSGNTEVLASGCSNKKGRWVREAIHVREQQQPTLNRNDGMYQLNHVWDSLLNNAVIATTTRQS